MVDFDYSPTPSSGDDYKPGSSLDNSNRLDPCSPEGEQQFPDPSTIPADSQPTESLHSESCDGDESEALDENSRRLTFEEGRVLGCLMEKARTTPDAYPLSLNSLTNACNQKTSRLPVTDLDDDDVMEAVEGLREKRLVHRVDQAGARTVKFQHRAEDSLELQKDEATLICVLLLRGPQTPGELRTRTERLYGFGSPAEVEEVLQDLMGRTEPLVQVIPAGHGRKEARYQQLLGECLVDLPDVGSVTTQVYQSSPKVSLDRVEALETRVSELENKLVSLNEEFSQLRELLD